MTYAKHVSNKKTPQTQAIPGKNQIQNSAGGFSFQITCWDQLNRFLILGNENGSYYASERDMTITNVKCIDECISKDYKKTVDIIVEVSVKGLAPKNDPAIFALAYCAGKCNEVGNYALSKLNEVCRIGTHLFQFVESVRELRGNGRSLNTALKNWYLTKDNNQLAYQLSKYQSRGNYSHRDVLRLCKPKTSNEITNQIFRWSAKNDKRPADVSQIPLLKTVEEIKTASSKKAISLIQEHKLVREVIPTNLLNDVGVWEALLENMPLTALIRNLGKMSSIGLIKPLSKASRLICDRLIDQDLINKARLHPLNVFNAQKIYSQGHGDKGSLNWSPDQSIKATLEDTFMMAFKAIEPSNKRFLLALDVSGSMTCGNIAGMQITPRDGSAIMSMVTARTEPYCHTMAFSSTFMPLNITKKDSIHEVFKKVSNLPFAGTDCSLPMVWALQNKIEVDTFVVYTDSETYFGNIHPSQALKEYRQKMGIPAKLIVVGMVANKFSIADPTDSGMMDVVGFDSSAPAVMSNFAR